VSFLVRAKGQIGYGIEVEPIVRRASVTGEEFAEGGWGVKPGHLSGPAVLVAEVLEPEDLPVRRIDERQPEAVKVKGASLKASGISLGLNKDVLRAQA
jgi:hypothetical protein